MSVTATITRADIVAEARRWEGTPHKWQQSRRGHGCDCFGLIFGVGRDLGMPEAQNPVILKPTYRPDFKGDVMLAQLRAVMIETSDPQPGDILAIRVLPKDKVPRHLALLLDDGRIIHSYGRGVGRAIIVPLGKSRPVHSWWTWPSLVGGKGA